MTHFLAALLNPRSVAVIGASEDQSKFGGRLYKSLLHHRFAGEVYPINPVRDQLFGLRAFPSIGATPKPPDMVVMAVPTAKVLAEVAACARHGVKAAIIITSKFSDAGPEGLALEREIVAVAARHGMRLIGPNCLGLISPANRLALCSSPALEVERLLEAPIGLVSQSGALMGTLFDRAHGLGIGFSHCVSIGNQADLELCDFVEFLIDDPATGIVCSYVEGIKSPRRMLELARRARAAGKPWLMVKSGSSAAGRQAAYSHTASLAGDHEALKAVCERDNIVLMDDPLDMLSLAHLMVRYPGRRVRQVAVITPSGGAGAIAADRLSQTGIALSRFGDATRQQFLEHYPRGQADNPIDVGGRRNEADAVGAATAQIALADPATDLALVVMTTAPDVTGLARDLADGAEREGAAGKPMLHVMLPGRVAASARQLLLARRLPFVDTLAEAVGVLQGWRLWSDYREPQPAQRPRSGYGFRAPPPGALDEAASKALLAAAGIPVNEAVLVQTAEQAVAAADRLGFPLVLKVVSPDIVHKSDVGGVALGIDDAADLCARFARMHDGIAAAMPGARIEGYALQRHEAGELELIVGARTDAQFGPLVLVGAGGVLVELLKDVRVVPAPADHASARAALSKLGIAPLLGAYRGRGALDLDAVLDVVVRLGWLAHDLAQADGGRAFEIEVNPLLVRPAGKGVLAVDARVRTALP